MLDGSLENRGYSDKSYVTAAVLTGIFGVLGIHHFYVGRWGHGLFDLLMTIVGVSMIVTADSFSVLMASGILLLLLDGIHTVYFMYKLIVGEYRDGNGRLIPYPGQHG